MFAKLRRLKKLYEEYIVLMFICEDRKSIYHQIIDIVNLVITTRYWPQNYFKFGGYKKGVSTVEISKYIPGKLFDNVRINFLNSSKHTVLVEDKFIFNKFLASTGVSSTSVLGVYWPDEAVHLLDGKLITLRDFLVDVPSSFVIKPVSGSAQGKGVLVIDVVDAQTKKFKYSNKYYDIEGILAFILDRYNGVKVLFEEKIVQHDVLSKLHKTSVNTLRIDTLLTPGGDVVFGNAFLRIGRNGSNIDNWSGIDGGIGVKVDLNTGKLAATAHSYQLESFKEHPDSGIKFDGVELPFWNQVLEKVERLAKLNPELRSLGWDIAFGKNGPIIIEANHDYALLGIQVCGLPYLTHLEFVKVVREYINKSSKGKKYIKYFPLTHA